MKFTAALLMLASLAQQCSSTCFNVDVYANDQSTSADAHVTPNLALQLAAVDYLCPWQGPIRTNAVSLREALVNPVAVLLAFAVTDGPVWTSAERQIVKEAMYNGRLSYLMVYDWISYAGTTDRMIPGLAAAFVSPGHSQRLNIATAEGNSIVSPSCWVTTGAISNAMARHQQGLVQFTAKPFYSSADNVTAIVDYRVPRTRARVHYSTAFLWAFLLGQLDCGQELTSSMLSLFNDELTRTAEYLTLPPISVDYTHECPDIVGTKSWIHLNKKFFPVSLMQDPDDVEDLSLTININSCVSSEPGKRELGTDCYVDETDESLGYVRASRDSLDVGRLYGVSYFATNAGELNCAGTVYVCVPHVAPADNGDKTKPDGTSRVWVQSCPNPDELIDWSEHLENMTIRNYEAWETGASPAVTPIQSPQASWQWSAIVGLCTATLVVAISTLTTICFQLRSNWQSLKEEAFASALVMSPHQVERASPTPVV